MKAADELLGAVFNKDHRYVIPIFQRPYVWDEEDNWIPLWNELRKAAEQAENQTGPDDEEGGNQEFFLGALVTQERPSTPRRIHSSLVIDGQQRLTTIQVFLAAARRVADNAGATHAADSFSSLVQNRVSRNTDHPEDRYKIAPLDHDRAALEWALRGPNEQTRPKRGDHKLVRAADWFEASIGEWIKESATPSDRLDLLHFAIENRVKVVSIFLSRKDDPQTIFEALNYRGIRLSAADLVKNLLFQTLERQGQAVLARELLDNHWGLLDSGDWREEVTTGRIKRVRADVLLAYWLSVQRGEESAVEHLFDDFKRWMRSSGARASEVITDIRVYANTMSYLQALPMSSPIAQVMDRLTATKTTTPWPLLLLLHADKQVSDEQAEIGSRAIDSYLMRRTICRMTTKDYNRLFSLLIRTAKDGGMATAGETVRDVLAEQTAPSRVWPDDSTFEEGLLNPHLYQELATTRVKVLLTALENRLASSRTEPSEPRKSSDRLSIEHIMPVQWEKHWPLPFGADEDDKQKRETSKNKLGNLTLLTQSLNSTLSNQSWESKRHTLQSYSLVRLTHASVLTNPEGISGYTQDSWLSDWDENRIDLRSKWLARIALEVWPHPTVNPDPIRSSDLSMAAPIKSRPGRSGQTRSRAVHDITGDLLPLIRRGLIAPGDHLRHSKVRTNELFEATVTSDGGLKTSLGYFRAPSTALSNLIGTQRNGWRDWIHVPSGQPLDRLRDSLGGTDA
ncbi:GmrSD restriction endonuclease domain-containing protein [Enemella evansiae]|uniref:GmrSD restriction endonuclease domain-containing protein n=1 Tax=Enemella evansiae TaxID=2016499 RepID=UPI000B97C7FD|nr:DUF262 domain-containing protein [Enemella evansiae]OYN99606.1 hypothetical protein CGZ97_20595 [Enemella evansiae]